MDETEAAGAGEQGGQQDDQAGGWGRALDWAGAVAAVALVAILIDIWSDGRLISRRLRGGQGGEGGEDEQPGDA
jgi:hypothetical protein